MNGITSGDKLDVSRFPHDRAPSASEMALDSLVYSVKKSLDFLMESQSSELNFLKSILLQLRRDHEDLKQEWRDQTSLLNQEFQFNRANEDQNEQINLMRSILLQVNRNHELLVEEGKKNTMSLHQELKHIQADLSRVNSLVVTPLPVSGQDEVNFSSSINNASDTQQSCSLPLHGAPKSTIQAVEILSEEPDSKNWPPKMEKSVFYSTPTIIFESAVHPAIISK